MDQAGARSWRELTARATFTQLSTLHSFSAIPPAVNARGFRALSVLPPPALIPSTSDSAESVPLSPSAQGPGGAGRFVPDAVHGSAADAEEARGGISPALTRPQTQITPKQVNS